MALKMDHTGAGDITLDSTQAGELRVDGVPVFIPDLTGAADNDLLFRSGGNWIDTAGDLTWDGNILTLGDDKKLRLNSSGTGQADIYFDGTTALNIDGSGPGVLTAIRTDANLQFLEAATGRIIFNPNYDTYLDGSSYRIEMSADNTVVSNQRFQIGIFPSGEAFFKQIGISKSDFRFGGSAMSSGAGAYYFNVNSTTADFNVTILTEAATASTAYFRLPHGTAPTTPVDGDLWTTTTGVFARVNGVTEDLTAGAATLGDLSDVDLTGAADNDLLVRSGGNWVDTGGLLTWNTSNLEVAGEIRNTKDAPAFTGRANATAGARRLLEFENWDGVSAYEDNWRMIMNTGAGNAALVQIQSWNGASFQSLIEFDADGTATNRLIFPDGAISEQNFNIVKPGADGDSVLTIEADSDNLTEASNPYVRLWQDGQAIGGLIGLTGAADEDSAGGTFTGAQNNSLAIHMDTVTSATDGIALGVNGTAKLVIQRDNPTQIRDNLYVTESVLELQGSLPLFTFGASGTGFTGSLGTTQHTDSAALAYRTYLAHDCYWDETNDEWVAHRTTLARKFAITMGFHQHDMQFRYYGGSAATPWADSAWTSMLTLDPGNGLTSTPYPLRTGGNIGRSIDTSSLTVFGGNATGANVELYGGSHATLANHAYFDADDHYFRTQNAGTTMATITTGGLVSNVTIFAGSGNLNDGDIMLRLNSDRAWDFKQGSADASASLVLQPTADSKAFYIRNQAGNPNFAFVPYNSGTADPIFRIYDAAGTDYAQFQHTGTDLTLSTVSTELVVINDSPLALFNEAFAHVASASGTSADVNQNIYFPQGASYTSDTASVTGTGKITIPTVVQESNTMLQMRIRGYNYSNATGAWEIVVGGYNYNGGGSAARWVSCSATCSGYPPFDQVRFVTDSVTGDKSVLLGTTSTSWSYPKFYVEVVTTTYANQNARLWEDGWAVSIITSETNLTVDETRAISRDKYGAIYPGGQSIGNMRQVTGSYGSVEVIGAESAGTWSGYNIGASAVFMSNLTGNATTNRTGLYDDLNNAWILQFNESQSARETCLYCAGSLVFETTTTGAYYSTWTTPDTSHYLLNFLGSANWGIYWDTTDNRIEFHGAGTDRAGVDLDTGEIAAGSFDLDGMLVDNATYRSGIIGMTRLSGAAWSGWGITHTTGLWTFMGNDANAGIYDDLNNQWKVYATANAGVALYYQTTNRLATTSTGIQVTGDINLNNSSDTTLSRKAAGLLGVENRAVVTHASTSYTSAEITFSTGNPTGGADGDIWFKYT